MPTPEEDQKTRSAAILATIPGLEDRLMLLDPEVRSTEWTTLDRGVSPQTDTRIYELLNGKVSLDFRLIGGAQDYLTWYSDRPGFLNMGESMDSYLEFLEFSLGTLPEMLFGPGSGASGGVYTTNSTAILKYRTIQKDLSYALGSQKDRVRLATDLSIRPKQFEGLTVFGSKPDGLQSYFFLTSFSQSSPGSYLAIGVNSAESTPDVWNPLVIEWALGTHLDRNKLGDMTETSANLAAQLGQIKSPAIDS